MSLAYYRQAIQYTVHTYRLNKSIITTHFKSGYVHYTYLKVGQVIPDGLRQVRRRNPCRTVQYIICIMTVDERLWPSHINMISRADVVDDDDDDDDVDMM